MDFKLRSGDFSHAFAPGYVARFQRIMDEVY